MMQIDSSWLVNTVIINKKVGEDDWNRTIYEPKATTFEHVRVDMTKLYSGTGNDRTITANATVFLYADHTTNFPTEIDDSWLGGKLVFNGNEYVIKDWAAYSQVSSGELFSAELQVI